MSRIATMLGLVGVAPICFAQTGFPVSSDRPSFTDGTGIIPIGRWQIETGTTFSKVDRAEFQSIGEVLVRLPLEARLELRIGNVGFGKANMAGGGGQGLLDPWLGFKYRFQTGVPGKTPDLALVAQSTVPAGSHDFRIRRSQPSLRLAAFQQLNASDGIGGEVGFSNLGPSGASFNQWAISGYLSRTFNAKSAGFAEIYHLSPISANGPSATFLDAGVTYLLDKATQIDFRIGSGLNEKRDGWFIGAGIAFRF